MPQIPPGNFSPEWADDRRPVVPATGDERAVLTGFLEFHRATFESKCSGVPTSHLSERGVPPSGLSLHGLVRHLAAVERWWFRIQLAGEDVPMLFYSDDDPDQDFEALDGDVEEALSAWREECDRSRAVVAARALDDQGRRVRDGQPFALRWLLVNTIAEYARHNGHADLLRERIDGRLGQ